MEKTLFSVWLFLFISAGIAYGRDGFEPAWWCSSAHAQTIFARFFRPTPELDLDRKRLETPDGDFLDLDFLRGDKNSPVIVILHGLEGSSQASYVRSVLGEIRKKGWRGVAMNFRSCSGEPNRLKYAYHSGQTEDLDFVLRTLIEKENEHQIYLLGYSIGGNIVLKWLGEQGSNKPPEVQKAAAVSVPFDLVKSVDVMDAGFNREVYTRTLLSSLKQKVLEKEKRFPGLIDKEQVKRAKTFRIFDRLVTAPLNGFKDEMDYWTRSSSVHYLDRIKVPTLVINAKDDPFFPERFIPYEKLNHSRFLKTLFVEHGGHLGFVTGQWPWRQDHWLENVIVKFFEEKGSSLET